MTDRFNALSLSHRFLAEHVRPGDLCIDATAGRGYDTAYLAGLTGETGRVLAFDIQQEAVDSTNALLRKRGLDRIAQVHLDSHVNMERAAGHCAVYHLQLWMASRRGSQHLHPCGNEHPRD